MKKTIRTALILATVILCSLALFVSVFASTTIEEKDPEVKFEISDDYKRDTSYETGSVRCFFYKQSDGSVLIFNYSVTDAYESLSASTKKVYSRSDINTSIYEDKDFRESLLDGLKKQIEESMGDSGKIVGDLESDVVTVSGNKYFKLTYSAYYSESDETDVMIRFMHVNEGMTSTFAFQTNASEISDEDVSEILGTVVFADEVEGTTYVSADDLKKKEDRANFKSILTSGVGRGILYAVVAAVVAGIIGFVRKRKATGAPTNQYQPEQYQPDQYQPEQTPPEEYQPEPYQPDEEPAVTDSSEPYQPDDDGSGSEF